MQPHGIYNVVVNHDTVARKPPRVGLIPQRTGIPVFLLYLKQLQTSRLVELHSLEDVEAELHRTQESDDRLAWEMLLPFFEIGGSSAHVVAQPLLPHPKSLISQMIGKDKGLNCRTGIHVLKEMTEYADLVVVPQASSLLKGAAHGNFFEALFNLSEQLSHYFVIADCPIGFSHEQAIEWLKKVTCPNAAAYFPWMIKDQKYFPPGALVAAAYQISDETYGVHELAANRKLKGGFSPLVRLTPAQLQECLEHRLNVVHRFLQKDLKLWGGNTLADKLDYDSRFISTRRTVLGIQEAIHQICEPFVLEPATEEITELMEVSLQSFFQSVKRLFDPGAKEPFSTEICLKDEGGEDVIEVNVRFSLPYALNQMHFSLGVTG